MRYLEFKNKLQRDYDFVSKENCVEEIGNLKAFRILVARIKRERYELCIKELRFWKVNDRILAIEAKVPMCLKIEKEKSDVIIKDIG